MEEKITVQIDSELEELIPNYLKNLQTGINDIRKGIEDTDMKLCRRLGHNLKGSGGSYGFQFVSATGKEIEDAAKMGEKDKIKSSVDRLQDYLKRIQVRYY